VTSALEVCGTGLTSQQNISQGKGKVKTRRFLLLLKMLTPQSNLSHKLISPMQQQILLKILLQRWIFSNAEATCYACPQHTLFISHHINSSSPFVMSSISNLYISTPSYSTRLRYFHLPQLRLYLLVVLQSIYSSFPSSTVNTLFIQANSYILHFT
jgi:hypothetical protein